VTTKQNAILAIGITLILLNAIFGGQIQSIWSTVSTPGPTKNQWGGPLPNISSGLYNALGGVPPTPGGKTPKKGSTSNPIGTK
jgi:hypothetical protein